MFQDEKQAEKKLSADDLEPYRQLVELQRQMIELVRQHERTQGECVTLRRQLLEEMTRTRRPPWSLRPTAHAGIHCVKHLLVLWKARLVSRPQPNVPFLARKRLLKV